MRISHLFATVLSVSIMGICSVQAAMAQTTITQFNFNSVTPDSNTATGRLTPSVGSGTFAVIGGVTSTFAGGSATDPASSGTDNSAVNTTTYAAQSAGSGTRGVEFSVDTTGFQNITVSFDFRQSATASRFFQLQSSSNGSTFTNVSGGTASVGTVNTNTATTFTSAGLYSNTTGATVTFVQGITYSFAAASGIDNNANTKFRFVAVFDPANGTSYTGSSSAGTYGTTGTARFDFVTIQGTAVLVPEANTVALAMFALPMIGGMLVARRRK